METNTVVTPVVSPVVRPRFINPEVADIDPSKSPTLAAVLDGLFGLILLCGVGHFYLGRWGRGLLFILGSWLAAATIVGYFIVWAWAVVDANKLGTQAQQYATSMSEQQHAAPTQSGD